MEPVQISSGSWSFDKNLESNIVITPHGQCPLICRFFWLAYSPFLIFFMFSVVEIRNPFNGNVIPTLLPHNNQQIASQFYFPIYLLYFRIFYVKEKTFVVCSLVFKNTIKPQNRSVDANLSSNPFITLHIRCCYDLISFLW